MQSKMTDTEMTELRNSRGEAFLALLQEEAAQFTQRISTEDGDWIVKGFIDVFRRIYTISGDTKVVSKLIELMLLPGFNDFAIKHGLRLVLARQQNHYPDMSFVAEDGTKFAVDLKSTFRTSEDQCNTMTLGAFSGYFRDRTTTSTTTFPYGQYTGHFVLGVVYNRSIARADELMIHSVRELASTNLLEEEQALSDQTYSCETLREIPAVVRDLEFFAQPKYRIARDRPGSGNTKNIGGVGGLRQLIDGKGPFSTLGEEIFDDYWMNYLTKADAKAAGLSKPPYTNLKEYVVYKQLNASPDAIRSALAEADNADDSVQQVVSDEE